MRYLLKLLVALVLAAGALTYCQYANRGDEASAGSHEAATAPAASQPLLDKSEEKQAERKRFIEDRLIGGGLVTETRLSSPGTVRAVVTPAFLALEHVAKENFVGVVYAFYFDGSDQLDQVRLFDSRDGKEVGRYSRAIGGLKMD